MSRATGRRHLSFGSKRYNAFFPMYAEEGKGKDNGRETVQTKGPGKADKGGGNANIETKGNRKKAQEIRTIEKRRDHKEWYGRQGLDWQFSAQSSVWVANHAFLRSTCNSSRIELSRSRCWCLFRRPPGPIGKLAGPGRPKDVLGYNSLQVLAGHKPAKYTNTVQD